MCIKFVSKHMTLYRRCICCALKTIYPGCNSRHIIDSFGTCCSHSKESVLQFTFCIFELSHFYPPF